MGAVVGADIVSDAVWPGDVVDLESEAGGYAAVNRVVADGDDSLCVRSCAFHEQTIVAGSRHDIALNPAVASRLVAANAITSAIGNQVVRQEHHSSYINSQDAVAHLVANDRDASLFDHDPGDAVVDHVILDVEGALASAVHCRPDVTECIARDLNAHVA